MAPGRHSVRGPSQTGWYVGWPTAHVFSLSLLFINRTSTMSSSTASSSPGPTAASITTAGHTGTTTAADSDAYWDWSEDEDEDEAEQERERPEPACESHQGSDSHPATKSKVCRSTPRPPSDPHRYTLSAEAHTELTLGITISPLVHPCFRVRSVHPFSSAQRPPIIDPPSQTTTNDATHIDHTHIDDHAQCLQCRAAKDIGNKDKAVKTRKTLTSHSTLPGGRVCSKPKVRVHTVVLCSPPGVPEEGW